MSRRILVIDDDADIRAVIALSLEFTADWTVSQAGSGAEGLRAARADQPDAILLDLVMPGMDGADTARALADDPATRDLPVLLLSAGQGPASEIDAAALPVAGVLRKPFRPATLAAQCREVLGWTA